MFERPELLWLLLAAPLAVAPGLMAARAGRRWAGRGRRGAASSLFVILVAAARGPALAAQDARTADVGRRGHGRLAFDRARPIPVDAPSSLRPFARR